MIRIYWVKKPDSRQRITILPISSDETGPHEAKAGDSVVALVVETGAAGLLPALESPYCKPRELIVSGPSRPFASAHTHRSFPHGKHLFARIRRVITFRRFHCVDPFSRVDRFEGDACLGQTAQNVLPSVRMRVGDVCYQRSIFVAVQCDLHAAAEVGSMSAEPLARLRCYLHG